MKRGAISVAGAWFNNGCKAMGVSVLRGTMVKGHQTHAVSGTKWVLVTAQMGLSPTNMSRPPQNEWSPF